MKKPLDTCYAPEINEIAASYAFFMQTLSSLQKFSVWLSNATLGSLCSACYGIESSAGWQMKAFGVIYSQDITRLFEVEDCAISAQNASENARNMHTLEKGMVHFTRMPPWEARPPQRLRRCQRSGNDTHAEEAC